MRNDKQWLEDIIAAIEKITKYSVLGKEKFINDELIQVWVIFQFQVIGEAANKLSSNLKQNSIEIRWKEIVGLRNFIVHEYFGIDLDEIWNTVQKDIPILEKQILELIDKINDI